MVSDLIAVAAAAHVFVSNTCAPLVQEWIDGTSQKANSERVVIQATEQEHAGAAQLLHHALQTLQNA